MIAKSRELTASSSSYWSTSNSWSENASNSGREYTSGFSIKDLFRSYYQSTRV